MSAARAGSDDLRRRLLDAARDILREPDTPLELRKVAERAGKSRTAPYLVFGKEKEGGGVTALRIAVAADGADEMSRRMEAASVRADDPLEAFQAVAETVLRFSDENPRLFHLMYGTGIQAISGLGEEGLRAHGEFRHFLEGRDRAADVLSGIIVRAQENGLLRPDVDAEGEPMTGTPSPRYLQIAWAAMLGTAVLREDELLKAVGQKMDLSLGARRITEAVFGVDPGMVREAWQSFREAAHLPDTDAEHLDVRESRVAFTSGSDVQGKPGSGSSGGSRPEGGDWLGGLLRDLAGRRSPASAAREILQRLQRERGDDDFDPEDEHEQALRKALRRSGVPVADGPAADSSDIAGSAPSAPEGVDEAEGLDETGARADDAAGAVARMEAPLSPDAPPRPPGPSLGDVLRRHSGLRRAAYDVRRFRGAPILWIDDHPDWNEAETSLLRQLGFHVVQSRSTDDALRRLRRQQTSSLGPFRVILSDIARGSRPAAGVEALPRLREAAPGVPVIFYVGEMTPDRVAPKGSAGITDSPDRLLHLVLDALERG